MLTMTLQGCQQGPSVETLTGKTIYINQLRGKWVFLNYWASWCQECVTKIPKLNEFSANALNDKVVILGVNFDSLSVPELKALVSKLNIHYPILTLDPKQYFGIDNVTVLPTTYVFNPEGHLEMTLIGGNSERKLDLLAQRWGLLKK